MTVRARKKKKGYSKAACYTFMDNTGRIWCDTGDDLHTFATEAEAESHVEEAAQALTLEEDGELFMVKIDKVGRFVLEQTVEVVKVIL